MRLASFSSVTSEVGERVISSKSCLATASLPTTLGDIREENRSLGARLAFPHSVWKMATRTLPRRTAALAGATAFASQINCWSLGLGGSQTHTTNAIVARN